MFLGDAIESILNQTFRDFEFIIVADKSSDRSDLILDDYAKKDNRIKVFMEKKKGLIASLNKGCQLAKGKYIARMDADDISRPHRLEMQVQYLEEHPEIGVLGTGIRYIDEAGRLGKSVRNPRDPKLIKFYLHLENCFVHPSIMMRRETIEHLGFYNPEAIHAEDYDLWARATSVTQVSNLQDILLEYRVWSGGISSHNALSRDQTVLRIRQLMINKLMNGQVQAESIITPFGVANSSILEMVSKVCKVASLMPKLYFAYLNSNDLSPKQVLELACLVLVFFKNILKEIIRVKCDALQNRHVG
jgi:glycosyltransferase involved in cell wall biosynthesis